MNSRVHLRADEHLFAGIVAVTSVRIEVVLVVLSERGFSYVSTRVDVMEAGLDQAYAEPFSPGCTAPGVGADISTNAGQV